MPYIGNEVGNRFVASKAASVYSGNGSTTAFTLEHAVGSDEDILVSVDGVIQEPSVAYAVSSGTTLTFTAAPSSNSGNNIFVYYLFRTVATVDHPSTSALTATSGTFSTDLTVSGAFTSQGIDDNADATAITIDSSENVMFGTTTFNPYSSNVNGVSIRGGNTSMQVSKDGQVGILINRKTSDGQIVQFGKDGTAVGNIGSYSGSGTSQFYISGADTGFKINSSVDVIAPSNNAGANRDNAITLGDTSNRWKDLYLSGNVFIGGTGSANALDDYEEGTFTPALTNSADNLGAGYASRAGFYTKTGNSVHFVIHITLNAYTSSSNQVYVTGLPFTSKNVSNCDHYFLVSGGHLNVDSNYLYVAATLGPNTTQLTPLMIGDSVSRENFRSHDITATNAEFFITGNYLT